MNETARIPQTNRSSNHSFRPARPPKIKRWSHQQDLEAAKGKMVSLILAHRVGGDFDRFTGALIEADQFTVKLRDDEDGENVFFKSALAGFKVIG